MSASTEFEVQLYCCAMSLTSRENEKKQLKIFQSAMNSTLAGMAVKLFQNNWDASTTYCSLGPLRVVIKRYLWYNRPVLRILVLLKHSDDFGSLKQQETLFEADQPYMDVM